VSHSKIKQKRGTWYEFRKHIPYVESSWVCYCFQSNTSVYYRQCSKSVKSLYMCICYGTVSCMQCISILLYSVQWPTDRYM